MPKLSPFDRAQVLKRCSTKDEALDELARLEGCRTTWEGIRICLVRAGLPAAVSLLRLGPGGTTWGSETRAQKQQEYNERMGEAADMLADVARGTDGVGETAGEYIAKLADEEKKYVNRRVARSAAIGLARDALLLRAFQERLSLFPTRAVPKGWATSPPSKPQSRIVNLALSDLHFGAKIDPLEFPVGTSAITECRRLAKVIEETVSYKPQYREQTSLNVILLGDLIEGVLKHSDRDGDLLTDQFSTIVWALIQAIGVLAAAYPKVSVYHSTGNHGRNKLEHPGRATSGKWDSFESMIVQAVRFACLDLRNVSWQIDKRQHVAIPLFDSWLFGTHGDTLLSLGQPGKSLNVTSITSQLNAIQASGEYHPEPEGRFGAFVAGHVHTGVLLDLQPGTLLINPPLSPPNGFGRSVGAHRQRCGQWLWESVEGYPVGDARLLRVGSSDDEDSALDKIIKPLVFPGELP